LLSKTDDYPQKTVILAQFGFRQPAESIQSQTDNGSHLGFNRSFRMGSKPNPRR
jgi:hypothetical protein